MPFYIMITGSTDPIANDDFDTMLTYEECPTIDEILEKAVRFQDNYVWIIEREEFSTELQRMPAWSYPGNRLLGWEMKSVEIVPDEVFDDKDNIVYTPLPSNDEDYDDDWKMERNLYY